MLLFLCLYKLQLAKFGFDIFFFCFLDCRKCEFSFAPSTVTGGLTGVSNSTTGCICAGSNPNNKINPAGFYTAPQLEFTVELTKANPADRKLCLPCPPGANCNEDGTLVQMLSAQNGFWRPSRTSKIFADCANGYSSPDRKQKAKERCCPLDAVTNVSVCKNVSTTSVCLLGYQGPLCRGCDIDNSYVAIDKGQACGRCEGKRFVWFAWFARQCCFSSMNFSFLHQCFLVFLQQVVLPLGKP